MSLNTLIALQASIPGLAPLFIQTTALVYALQSCTLSKIGAEPTDLLIMWQLCLVIKITKDGYGLASRFIPLV